MSLKTWKKEFYTSVEAAAKRGPKAALKHSIRKWEGLKGKNLKKHDLTVNDYRDLSDDDGEFVVDDKSCALCVYVREPLGGINCEKCPIVKVTGKPCDGDDSPWEEWIDNKNPLPMNRLLNRVYKKLYGD